MLRYFDDGLMTWMLREGQRQAWRLACWADGDDLAQEGFFVFLRCLKNYRPIMPQFCAADRRQFMARFKVAFRNMVHDQSEARRWGHGLEIPISVLTPDGSDDISRIVDEQIGVQVFEGDSIRALETAPRLYRALFELMAAMPGKGRRRRGRNSWRRETPAERYARQLGAKPDHGEAVMKAARAFLATCQ